MVRISSIDIKRGKAIHEYPDGNYIDKEEPIWKIWHWSYYMGVRQCFSKHRMTKKEQEEFNKTQPDNLKLTIK